LIIGSEEIIIAEVVNVKINIVSRNGNCGLKKITVLCCAKGSNKKN